MAPGREEEAGKTLLPSESAETPRTKSGTTSSLLCGDAKPAEDSNSVLLIKFPPAQDTTATVAPEGTEATTSSSSRPSVPSGPKEAQGQPGMSTTTSPSAEPLEIGADPAQRKPEQTDLSVRRLTPTECEILQGFPSGWTVPDTEHWGTR